MSSHLQATLQQNLYELVDQKEQQIIKQQQDQNSTQQQLAQATFLKENLAAKVEELTQQNHKLKYQINQLRSKVSELQSNIDNLQLNTQSQGTMIIELEHLRADNAQLLQQLKKTKQCSISIYDNDDKNGLRFLSSLQNNQIPEKLLWVPRKAYEIAHEYSYKDNLSDQQIQLMLFEINKVWANREQEQNKFKQKQFELEQCKLKKQLNVPYNTHMMQQQMKSLKNQVQSLQKENIDLYANRPQRNIQLIQGSKNNSVQRKRCNTAVK